MEESAVSVEKFDLGSKNVWKTFLSILIPTLVAQLIAGTFIVFDTFFVSHSFHPGRVFDGSQMTTSYASLGTAAISYAQPYSFFIIGIGLAIGAGLASIMTRQLAKNDKAGMQKTMNSFGAITIYLGIAVGIVLFIFAKPLVWLGSGFQKDYLSAWYNNPLMNKNWDLKVATSSGDFKAMYNMVNGHILSQSAWFLRIQALGVIPYMYMIGGVIMLRVEGKAQLATIFSVTGLVTNILLDFILITWLKMNVVGAAIATTTGYFVTAAIYRWFFTKKAEIKETTFDWSNARSIFKMTMQQGTSIMMLQLLSGLILLIFTFSIGITNYGNMYDVTNYTAVYQGYNALFIFVNLVIVGVVQSMKPIIDYNYQKNDFDNVKKGRNIGMGVGLTFAIVVTLIVVLWPDIIKMFYDVNGSSQDYITTGYFGINGLPDGTLLSTGQYIVTDGMSVAESIVGVLFVSFPLAVLILIVSAYLQGIERQSQSSILTFGKAMAIFPIIIMFGFVPQLSTSFHSTWSFVIKDTNDVMVGSFTEQAKLGMFLALPITDLIFGVVTIIFYILVNKNIFIDHKKQPKMKV